MPRSAGPSSAHAGHIQEDWATTSPSRSHAGQTSSGGGNPFPFMG